MICVIALIVFAVLAVFSAKYRPLAAEAFDCVFRRVTLRKCASGLDKRLKARITGKVMRRHKAAGRFVFRYFEVFSWLFLLLLVLSLVQIGISTYNVAVYGNCYGPDESGFCIFDPTGQGKEPEVSVCSATGPDGALLSAPALDAISDHPQTGSASSPVTIIEFGCFACPNTAEQAPAVKRLIEHYGKQVRFIYVDFPLSAHELAEESTMAAHCVYAQDELAYWQYHFTLFERQEELSTDNLYAWADLYGLDMEAFGACMEDPDTLADVRHDVEVAQSAGVYGTPTFFIDGEPVVGVSSYRFLKAKVDDALKENN